MTELSSFAPVTPNGIVGILGGGQLGRMLAQAAARLGLQVHVFCPEHPCPAGEVAHSQTVADYTDEAALEKFAAAIDVVTYEFENVPAQTVRILNDLGKSVAPNDMALSIAQDRLKEKEFVLKVGGRTCQFHPVDDLDSLGDGLKLTGRPAILKTRHLGYDGKGQTRIGVTETDLSRTWEEAIEHAWKEVGAKPSILEAYVSFQCEISIIAARGRNGEIAIYDAPENEHHDGILATSTVPSSVSAETLQAACTLTETMLTALDYVGVVGVEFFVLNDGSVMVNEFAPRVHNSGHWTEAACLISQFEQHIRAVCGWPLGDSARHSDAIMENLLGEDVQRWQSLSAQPGTLLNLYGKREARAGRKMGHVTKISTLTS